MLNSLATLQSCAKYNSVAAPPPGSASITSISGSYALNDSQLSISGYTVYKFYNSSTPTSLTSISNATGSFTLTITGGTKTVYIFVISSGPSGSSGNQGSGGSSSGQYVIQTLNLPIGTYSVSYQVGGSCKGSDYVASGSYIGPNQNGWGAPGGNSYITINGSTYTAKGGLPGAPSGYSASSLTSSFSGYPLGSGAGTSIGHGALSGYDGTINDGGNTPTSTSCSGGSGGASMAESGFASSASTGISGNPCPGGRGGKATRSIDLAAPWNGFSTTQYFCEAAAGTACRTATSYGQSYSAIAGFYGFAGSSSGTSDACTDAVVNSSGGWGSAGGSSFQLQGRASTYIGGAGTNGLLLVAFT
jgi:hypothetical protein